MLENEKLQQLIEGLLLAVGKPLTEADILHVFDEEEQPALSDLRQAIYALQQNCEQRGFELVQIASGYQLRVKPEFSKLVSRLFAERPAKYTRALLETLALIAYRQPITRGDIEDIRGVGVSTSIFKTLDERGWIRVVGKRDVPGKPSLYATTKAFLDYFGLKVLEDLPSLPEVMQMEMAKNLELEFDQEVAKEFEVSAEAQGEVNSTRNEEAEKLERPEAEVDSVSLVSSWLDSEVELAEEGVAEEKSTAETEKEDLA